MSWAEELADLNATCTGAFPTPAVYRRPGGPDLPLEGILTDAAHLDGLPPGVTYRYFVDQAQFAGVEPDNGDRLALAGVEYVVERLPADHSGGVTLHLRRAR